MKRYLLFDSGCSTCTALARAIEIEAGGRLQVRSLGEPDMQRLLNQTRPGWRWEPTLLEVCDDAIRVYTGLAMGIRLVRILGPRQALRLKKLANRYTVSLASMGPPDPGRRHFLQRLGPAFAALALPFRWPDFSYSFRDRETIAISSQQTGSPPSIAGELSEAEIWEGFLLLPTIDAPWPSFVQCAPTPILCHTGDQYDSALRGEIVKFNSIEELVDYIPFSTYMPAILPPNMQFVNASVIRFAQSGSIFDATLDFGAINAAHLRIRVRARIAYPRPYPVRPVHSPVFQDQEVIQPEKVAFTPSPGIIRPSARGHVLHWIQSDVLYTLVAEHDPSREAAVEVAQQLVRL